MKVTDVFKDYEMVRCFILDSHQDAMIMQEQGHRHADRDYCEYSYNVHRYNQLLRGSFFLYRRPGKLSKDGSFKIYGGGVISSISEPDSDGNVIAKIEKGFSLVPPITQGDEFIENYKWHTRSKPGPGWKGFWVNYGMNKISEKDFFSLTSGRDCNMKALEDDDDIENLEDKKLINDINNAFDLSEKEWVKKDIHEPKEKSERTNGSSKAYKRKRSEAINALKNASNLCEVNPDHESFTRKGSSVRYMEPHHLIPMKYQDDFQYSVDMEENIVCLCSNCHNMVHYGNAKEVILSLFRKRKVLLKSIGIDIDEEILLSMYGL